MIQSIVDRFGIFVKKKNRTEPIHRSWWLKN